MAILSELIDRRGTRRAIAYAFLLVFCAVAEAGAGWRYAEWGMTKSELAASAEREVKPYLVANRRQWGEYPDLVGSHRTADHKFEVWFYFGKRDGKLYALRLVPIDEYWCIDVRDNLISRHGIADRFENGDPVWEDGANNNRISVISFRGCTVKYERLNQP